MSVASKLGAAKLLAEIAEISSKVYATVVEKSRERQTKEARIKELEAELAALKASGLKAQQ